MLIGIINDNEIKIGHYKELFYNVSFPSSGPDDGFLAAHNAKKVNLFKEHDRATQKLVSCQPYVEGDWIYTVEVQNKTQDEINADINSKAAQLRATRDNLLKQSDWRVIRAQETGVPMDSDWATYRQALRDLPSDPSWPNVQIPNSPDYVPMGQ